MGDITDPNDFHGKDFETQQIKRYNRKTAINFLFVITGGLFFLDIVWLIVSYEVWTKKLPHDSAWNNFRWLHYTILLLGVANLIIKIFQMLYLWLLENEPLGGPPPP